MKYITIKEASKKWGITERSVRRYCVEGQVVGAIMVNKHFKIKNGRFFVVWGFLTCYNDGINTILRWFL